MERKIIKYSTISTKIGEIYIARTKKGICRITIGKNENEFLEELENKYKCIGVRDEMQNEKNNLLDYFSKKLKGFELRIDFLEGTKFQKKVWKAISRIPYGKTSSYKQIAKKIGNENAYRAVGNAVSKNPIPIIVPCHRVIKKDGSLGGYSLGIWRKKKLLCLEGIKI